MLRVHSDGHSHNRDDSDGIQDFEMFCILHLVLTRKFPILGQMFEGRAQHKWS